MAYGQEPSGSSYGSQTPQGTTGGSSPGGGTGSTGQPVDWSSFQPQLPEEYRSDPSKFTEAYRDSSRYKDWYHKEYEPRHKSFDAQSYQQYLQSRQQLSDELIDWDDFTAPKRAYEQLSQRYKSLEAALNERTQ